MFEELRTVVASQQPRPGASSGLPLIAQRYQVLPSSRLPDYDSPYAEAFQASDTKASSQELFALVCRRDIIPRIAMLDVMARSDRGTVLRPIEWEVVDWPPAGAQRFVILFPRPGGGRLVAKGQTVVEAWKPDDVVRRLIQPLLPFLKEAGETIISHRAIRADNLFHSEPGGGPVILGECVSAPPGIAQDIIYETIENGMAEPAGRGVGGPPDDLYALGVLLVILLTGKIPCADMAPQEIVAAKLKIGSYGALVGKAAMPLKMTEPLRGLLCDDPKERWTVTDLEFWLNGRHLTPKQPSLPTKATRPFRFAGEQYFDARSLAHAMACDWDEACKALQDDGIVEWVRRALSANDAADEITALLRMAQLSGAGESRLEDHHVAQILMILDPRAPLRYRNFAVNLEALGRSFALNGQRTDWFRCFDELMDSKLPLDWLEAQPGGQPELVLVRKRVQEALRLYKTYGPRYGAERCLYALEPNCPCQSKILEQEYVTGLRDLLPGLERAAGRGRLEGDPMDGHIAAFCGTHLKEQSDALIDGLAQNDPQQLSLAATRLLAEVQRRTGPLQLPAVTGWLAERLRPLVGTFHHRPYREELEADLGRVVARGVLGELCGLLDNASVRRADQQGFAQGCHEFRVATAEIVWLEQGGLTGQANVHRAGRETASIISSISAGLLLMLITLVHWIY